MRGPADSTGGRHHRPLQVPISHGVCGEPGSRLESSVLVDRPEAAGPSPAVVPPPPPRASPGSVRLRVFFMFPDTGAQFGVGGAGLACITPFPALPAVASHRPGFASGCDIVGSWAP